MNEFTRRRFLKAVSLLPLAIPGSTAGVQAPGRQFLSFSTLGCPDWDLARILTFASANKYNGIEIRGLQRQLDLTQCPEFKDAAAIKDTRQRAEDHNIKIVNLGSSAALHHTAKEQRQQSLDEAKRYIELAGALKCPYVRVFPDKLPKDDTRAAVIELIIQGLQYLGDFAKGTGVTVLLESHGDVVYIADLEKIMHEVNSRRVALIWDIANMWLVTKEAPVSVFQRLGRFIRHVHIKDAVMAGDGKPDFDVLPGRGIIPLADAVSILFKNNYRGYYSFEWEKLWHPEIEAPETALADFPVAMQKLFKNQPV